MLKQASTAVKFYGCGFNPGNRQQSSVMLHHTLRQKKPCSTQDAEKLDRQPSSKPGA